MPDFTEILNKATVEAKDFINNPSRLDQLLVNVEATLNKVPVIGESVSELPTMIAMVKSWIKKEYDVSYKVLATMVGAFIYAVKDKDIIPDNIPLVGRADDIAVIGLALKFVEPEVKAYKAWRDGRR
ncbi:MAG: DUF1232 domain-containing protein [Clostridia bacterium]|nr:DUF1232 domain-containing protein [Clostridia bacterium]MBR0407659.1 DUF1232 domain-containing protein [Clostridia bacterium]